MKATIHITKDKSQLQTITGTVTKETTKGVYVSLDSSNNYSEWFPFDAKNIRVSVHAN